MYRQEIACETKQFLECKKIEPLLDFRESVATQANTNDDRLSTWGNYSVLTT